MTKLNTAAADASAAQDRLTVGPAEASEMLRNNRAGLVDVREPDEFRHERIEGSLLLPLSRLDDVAARLPPTFAKGDKLIVYCRSGRRAADAVSRLRARGYGSATSLAGGIEGWKAAGFAVTREESAPLPIRRQVQLTIGVVVLIGVVLSAFVSPWFLVLPAFMGTGLIFAGATGWCGLAIALGAMPWNRIRSESSQTKCHS